MPQLDAATLLMVTAVVNAFACVVWLILGQGLNIAPRAAWRVSAHHLLLAVGWWPMAWAGWETAVGLPFSLLSMGLLAGGVRCLMRLREQAWDVVVITTAGLLAMALQYPDPLQQRLTVNLCGALLAALAGRDIVMGSGFNRWITALLALPYAVLTLGALWRAAALLGWRLAPVDSSAGNSDLALLRLLLDLGMGTGLVALVLQRLLSRIRHLTRSDALTGLLNRRAVDELLVQLQAQVQRGRQHALLVLDVDHFKRFNDELGHAGGDAALQHLGELLGGALRDTDRFGRVGGEEFAVLLPDTDLDGALLVAERLRQLLTEHPLAWGGKTWPLTASFGVAAMQRGDAHGREALARADAAMYRAKADGRNRVATAGAASAVPPTRAGGLDPAPEQSA